jgi:deoxycytidylate deaminase
MTKNWSKELSWIEKLHQAALKAAEDSPCERRKYGVAIGDSKTETIITANNARVCNSCDDSCIRTKLNLKPGEKTELGGEVHAEQAALIESGKAREGTIFFLAGIAPWGELYDPKPCPACAKMLLFAGYESYITLTMDFADDHKSYVKSSIRQLVKDYEMEVRDAAGFTAS